MTPIVILEQGGKLSGAHVSIEAFDESRMIYFPKPGLHVRIKCRRRITIEGYA